LRRFLSGQPISASADSAWYLVRRRLERYRLALALSAAAVVALAGLALYANFQRARADGSNVALHDELTTSTIERGRLLSLIGNLPNAEEFVWRELFRNPDSRHAQWTLWDIYSREPSLWVRTYHDTGTQTVRFSPDGRLLLTAGRLDGLLRLVEVESGRIVRTMTTAPVSGTRRALFTPDGKTIVSGSDDGSIRVLDVESGQLRREYLKAVAGLQDFALTADASTIVTAAHGAVEVWSLATGQLTRSFADLASEASTVTTSPDRSLILAGSNDGTVTAIDLTKGVRLWQRKQAHPSQVLSVAIGPGNRMAASGSIDGTLHLWNPSTGEPVRTIATENGRVRSLVFTSNGSSLIGGGVWRTRMWSLDEPSKLPRDLGGSEGITEIDLRSDDRFVATCDGGSGRVRLWDLAADSRTDRWSGHKSRVLGLEIANDGPSFVTVANDAVTTWRAGQPSRGLSIQLPKPFYGVAVSAKGQWLASVGLESAAVWDARTGRFLTNLTDVATSRTVIFSDDERRIHVGQPDGTVVSWDWNGEAATNPRRLTSQDTEVLGLVSRGAHLFVAHQNRVVTKVDRDTGTELQRFRTTASPFAIALSPDGRTLAAGTFSGTIYLWDVASGQARQLKGQGRLVGGVDFSPDGRMLASSSRDGTTRLWDVATGQWLATVGSRTPGAEHVRFLPDGRRLAIGYEDGEVEVRDLQYFFRYAAGHTEYELRLFREAGESFPRSDDVLAWSHAIVPEQPPATRR
jgi:WD40 repeat protein